MTVRAVIIGIVCVLGLAIAIPYCDLVMHGTWVGLTAFPISSFFTFVVLVLGVNFILKKLNLGLKSSELLLIYIMMLVGAGIPSFGLTGLLIPYIAGPFYFASPENKYATTFHQYIPDWMRPDKDAIRYLYEGLPQGMPIPWQTWVKPLLMWTVLAILVYIVYFCLSTILRKQWIENEKLVFPLTSLPVEMVQEEPGRENLALPPFFKNKIMWGFFLVPFIIHTINGLSFYFPAIPKINVHLIDIGKYFTEKPWNALQMCFWLRIPFSIIGLTYILPVQLSFSLWFFYFFFRIQEVIANMFGFPLTCVQAYPVRAFVGHQMAGGILMFAILGLWGMRRHLKDIVRKAFRGDKSVDDSNELFSYQFSIFGLIIGLIAISFWGKVMGASFWLTLLIFILYFLMHIVAVRLVCEGGMLYVQHPFRPWNIMLAAAGSNAFGPANITWLTYFDHLWMVDNRSPLMPAAMQGFKITSDSIPGNRKWVGVMCVVSILIAIAGSYWSYLRLMYKFGGVNLHYWFTTYYTKNLYSTWTTYLINTGEKANPVAMVTMGIGAATMWFILFMHRTFLWWPFHPIGYLMGATWPMLNFWFPIFLGWLFKTVIMKFGGIRIYKKLMPGFLGFILAEFFSAGLWVVIDFFTGVKGHEIFSF